MYEFKFDVMSINYGTLVIHAEDYTKAKVQVKDRVMYGETDWNNDEIQFNLTSTEELI